METPKFARMVTRSQASASPRKSIESKNKTSKQYKDGEAMIDITNDSPIIGVAMGGKLTPVVPRPSLRRCKKTPPGSGEALLRGQVKTLLSHQQKDRYHIYASSSLIHTRDPNTPKFGPLTKISPAAEERNEINRKLIFDYLENSKSVKRVCDGLDTMSIEKKEFLSEVEEDGELRGLSKQKTRSFA